MMIIGISFAVSHMKYMGGKKYLGSEIARKLDHEGKHKYLRLSVGTMSSESWS